jgi:5'-3' exonuclease
MIGWDEVTNRYGDGNNLLLVDGINFAMRFSTRSTIIYAPEFLANIRSIAKSYGCRKIIILSDNKGSSYRKDIYPEYKANRQERRDEQTQEERDAFEIFFKEYLRSLELAQESGITVVSLKGVEADDLATYFCNNTQDLFTNIWLCSTDGDWDQLLQSNIKRFSYKTRKEYTLDNFYDNHGCDTPEQFTHIKAIQGDMGDNVRGVDGIGPKRAYNLIREYGSVHEIYAALPLEGNQLFIKNLNKFGDKLLLNLQLVDLPSYYGTAIDHAAKLYNEDYFDYLNKVVGELHNA